MKYPTYRQTNISDFFHSFDTTKSQITFDSLVTSTDGYMVMIPCQINHFFYYRHRQGHSRQTDPYNAWWIPEDPDGCSRADIARTYCLGAGF
jgi:hypothetical protein